MTKHLFLTGRKGVGKSTLIRGLLAAESAPLGGFFTVKHQGGIYLLPAPVSRHSPRRTSCFTAATAAIPAALTSWAAPRWPIPPGAACW